MTGDPDPKHISTSFVERSNLAMLMLQQGDHEPRAHGSDLHGLVQLRAGSQDAPGDPGDRGEPEPTRVDELVDLMER